MKSSDTLLVTLGLSFVAAGGIEGAAPMEPEWPLAVAMFHGLLVTVLIFEWCGLHASENCTDYIPGSKLMAALLPPLGVPFFLVSCHGLKAGGGKVMKAALLFALCETGYLAAHYLVTLAASPFL